MNEVFGLLVVDESVSERTAEPAESGEEDETVNCTRMMNKKMNRNLVKCMVL